MTTYFVTRHPGARAWAEAEGIEVDEVTDHLDVNHIGPGDRVIGILPVNLAAAVCERGGRFFNLSMQVPPEKRGRELTAQDMQDCGARIEEYGIKRFTV